MMKSLARADRRAKAAEPAVRSTVMDGCALQQLPALLTSEKRKAADAALTAEMKMKVATFPN
jgi:hypothetical protein